jgi:small GTP-binding protein
MERPLEWHSQPILSIAWSPTAAIIAGGTADHVIGLWDVDTTHVRQWLRGHTDTVSSIAWSPDGQALASGSADRTIRIWSLTSGQSERILEGHTADVTGVAYSAQGHLLVSTSENEVLLWRCDIWERVSAIDLLVPNSVVRTGVAFHPLTPTITTLDNEGKDVCIWDIDLDVLLGEKVFVASKQYANAKVVLVGDSGVGKSGLGIVLAGHPFIPTESTHGRHVWTFETTEANIDGWRKEMREILLWDLAGQPGYRLVHRLHLSEVAAALVVFDARSELDPFAGVHDWERALRQAHEIQGNFAAPLKKLLVAARSDRGGISVTRSRIDTLVKDLGFDGYVETSAKEGWGINELMEAIRNAISWDRLPKVSSTELFQKIKTFLIEEKKTGQLLSTSDNLFQKFLKIGELLEGFNLRAQFDTCIGRVESRGLVRRLSFGDFILLQPELLDAYASALVNAARDEPDGLGSISEEQARHGDFRMPQDERILDTRQEKLLLIATVEDLLHHEIARREASDEGSFLVFPSQLRRERPDLPDPEGKAVSFLFEGPIQNIYATLAVRLAHSGVFSQKELWKNAATYVAGVGGMCGMFLRDSGEGRGELTLFFDSEASEQTRIQFEEYVHSHLQRKALSGTIVRRRILVCSACDFIVTDQLFRLRSERGFDWLDCPVCSTRISLVDQEAPTYRSVPSLIIEMDQAADQRREIETAASVVQGKIAASDFDVFLCHNHVDKVAIREIGEQLKERGILPWLDEWELRPGLPWQRALEQQISHIKSAAVFVGQEGIGPWQRQEIEAFLREFVDRGCPVIPVLLPTAPQEPKLPIFLRSMTWIDFRKQSPHPLNQLIWGITGKKRNLLEE